MAALKTLHQPLKSFVTMLTTVVRPVPDGIRKPFIGTVSLNTHYGALPIAALWDASAVRQWSAYDLVL
jgi:hypothetical protein